VLFSNDAIANFINLTFEPVWQSVRPAAIVRVDFGNGRIVTRTLNGNVATYICMPDGHVLDVLPGIYDPDTYLSQLRQGELFFGRANQNRRRLDVFVKEHHRLRVAALQISEKKPRITVQNAGRSIFGVEKGLKRVLKRTKKQNTAPVGSKQAPVGISTSGSEATKKLAGWNALVEDSRINETSRRLKIHKFLAKNQLLQPSQMTAWLYRDVLNTDLADPYLGLGDLLFAKYPFAAEDNSPR